MARTSETWLRRSSSYVRVASELGLNVLIYGTNKYLNFGSVSGESGYGFRDNNGTMQVKNSGGSWANFGAGGAGAVDSVNSQTGVVVLDADDIDDSATAHKFATAAQLTKIDHITVTQAVDLDTIESRVNELDASVILKGGWDASAGTFPGAGAAQAGWSYIVTVGGTVDGVVFTANDRIVAILDNASTTTYAANWLKLDYTDAVLSVDINTGAIDLATILHAKSAKTTPVDDDTFPSIDSAASNVLKKVSWANIKATIKAYYDSVTATLSNKTLETTVVVGELRLDATPTGDETAVGPTTNTINAGATIAKFELLCLASDGEWALADADASSTTEGLLAIALAAGTDGNALLVALPGSFVRDDTWTWTVGGASGAIYASTTPGALTQTPPSATDDVVRIVGYAVTADIMYFMPQQGVVHV